MRHRRCGDLPFWFIVTCWKFLSCRAYDTALPAFCLAVSSWLPVDRFDGESRMSCRVDETRSRMEHARKSSAVASTREPVPCAANNASALVTLEAYLYRRRRNCMRLNGSIFTPGFIDTSIRAIRNNDPIITSIWQVEEWRVHLRRNYDRMCGHVSSRHNWIAW